MTEEAVNHIVEHRNRGFTPLVKHLGFDLNQTGNDPNFGIESNHLSMNESMGSGLTESNL